MRNQQAERALRETRTRRNAIAENLRAAHATLMHTRSLVDLGERSVDNQRHNLAREVSALINQFERVMAVVQLAQIKSEEPGHTKRNKIEDTKRANRIEAIMREFE